MDDRVNFQLDTSEVLDEPGPLTEAWEKTLREDGHAVFHAYNRLATTELSFGLDEVHLVISNTRVSDRPGIELIYELRASRDLPILREPFTAERLRGHVSQLLTGKPSLLDVGREGATEPDSAG